MQPGVDADACAKFADISTDHAQRALDAGCLLLLIEKRQAGYRAVDWTTELLAAGSLDQKRQVFRARLERFAPFAHVRSRLLQGFDLHAACREAKAHFD